MGLEHKSKGDEWALSLLCVDMYVAIPPLYSMDPESGIRNSHLDPLLMRYLESSGVDGVVLAYQNLHFHTHLAKIMYDSPVAFTPISVDLVVWRPRVGIRIAGRLSRTSPDHIGLLVWNCFNASIPRAGIPAEWVYEGEDENGWDGWVDGEGIAIPDHLPFTIRSVVRAMGSVSLEGSLVENAETEAD